MKIDRADVHYKYRLNDEEDYQIFEEKELGFKKAIEIFESFPWENELKLIEIQDSNGGITFSKGDTTKDRHLSFKIICAEHHTVSIVARVVLKKGVLMGLIGSQIAEQKFENISFNAAKILIETIFTQDLDSLYEEFSI